MSNPNSKEEYFIPINEQDNPLTPERLFKHRDSETEPIIIPTENKNRSVSAPTIPRNIDGVIEKKGKYESEKDLQRHITLERRKKALSSNNLNHLYTFPTLDIKQPTESKTQKRQDRLLRSDNRRKSALTILMDQNEEKEAMKKEDKKGGKRRKTRKSTNKKKNKKTRSKKQKGGISNDEKLLIKAAGEGNTYLVGKLLEKGVKVLYDPDEKFGSTALITAIENNHTEIAKMILEKGPWRWIYGWDESDWIGTTALMKASDKGNTEMVKLLLDKGADVNKKNDLGNTALMLASNRDNKEILSLLLEHGADVNEKNKEGYTAIGWASMENYTEIVSLLLEHGADVHYQDNQGKTPLSIAKYYKNPETSKIIQEHIDKHKLEQEQEASRQIQGIAKKIQKAAKYIEKAAEQIGPQHKVPEGLKENLGGNRKTRKSTKSKKRRTKKKKPQFLYNPNDPKKSFDVYIDKNPDDTITIKYTTVDDVKNTIQKLEKLYKNNKYSHKRIWQVGMIMKVRLEAMLKNKHLYPNAKNVKSRYELSKKYFKFLGKRTQEKDEIKRKKMIFNV